jgi:hypothetical protein
VLRSMSCNTCDRSGPKLDDTLLAPRLLRPYKIWWRSAWRFVAQIRILVLAYGTVRPPP